MALAKEGPLIPDNIDDHVRTSDGVSLDAGDLQRLLIDRVTDYAILALDVEGNVVTWNAGAERLTGYASHEIIGRHFSAFYPAEDLASGKPARELRIATEEGRVEDEGWRIRKDGTRIWANVVVTALRDDNGVLVGFAQVTRDMTTRRESEETLKRSEELFRLLVYSVKDYAIFMLDPKGNVATWNEGAQRIKGYTEQEILGKHFSIFYPAEDAGKPARELTIATNIGKYEEEGWRIRKDGSKFWASVVITAVRNAKGELLGFAKVTRDLTERRAAFDRSLADARRFAVEEAARANAELRGLEFRELSEQLHSQAAELERRSAEAETANRAKGEFLAAMSHELRTPLNAIGGYTQLLQMGIGGPVTDAQSGHLARIQRSQEHLLGVISDILSFSRIEAGQVEYVIASVPWRAALDAILPMIELQASTRGLILRTGFVAPELLVRADSAKLEQIVLNLLSNAVKFTESGGTIDVSCGTQSDCTWLRVRDTGIGISAEQTERIFAPFAQVGRSLATPVEGTGLGLSISREFAHGMSGELSVESEAGVGSTFTLRLPRG
jgi:PAS domain S-box-containing protein